MGKYLVVLGGLLLLCGTGRADSISPIWNVAGNITLVGNDVCGGPCVESIDFSFDVTETPLDPGEPDVSEIIEALPGATFVSFGPLNYNLSNYQVGRITYPVTLLDVKDSGDDELDLKFGYIPGTQPETPILGEAELYSCISQVCGDDFNTRYPGEYGLVTSGLGLDGVFIDTISLVPEPSTSTLLLLGLGALAGLAVAKSAKVRLSPGAPPIQ
jgi:PEP-CTERM motif